jgi:hypothetical protein
MAPPARRSLFPAAETTRGATTLLIAHRSAVDVRREALGQLRGVIVTAPGVWSSAHQPHSRSSTAREGSAEEVRTV